jgi:uncharacterized protein YndB with AHSA1/START domain
VAKLTEAQTAELDELFATLAAEVSLRIDAPRERVWDLITDVTRIGEFSLETIGAEWVEGATGPTVGACFIGTNQVGQLTFSRLCLVVEAERNRRFAYVVGDRFDGSRTGTWSFELEDDGDGTLVHHRFQHEPKGKSGVRLRVEREPDRAREIVEARKNYLRVNMLNTLEAMRDVLEAKGDG